MTFRTIDLQPLSLEQSSKFASLFARDLSIKPRQGHYHDFETKVGAVFDVVCKNFLKFLGLPLAIRLEGRAATFCLVNKISIRQPRDVDITFYFNSSLNHNEAFENGIKKAIAASLKVFFGAIDDSTLLRDCLWNFAKVPFAPTDSSAGGTMYLYSIGPQKHQCVDIKVSVGNFRGWVTLLDSFSIELGSFPLLGGSFEKPLAEALTTIGKKEIESLRPHEILSGGFERYLTGAIEGFLDKNIETLSLFLSKFSDSDSFIVKLKTYLDLHHGEKDSNFQISFFYQAILALQLLKKTYNESHLRFILDRLESKQPHYAYLGAYLGKTSFDQFVSPYSLIISLFDKKFQRQYASQLVFSFSFGSQYLHFPWIPFERAFENYCHLESTIKNSPLFHSVLIQLFQYVCENKELLIDQEIVEKAIRVVSSLDPVFAWVIYDNFSSSPISEDLLLQLPKVYQLLEGKCLKLFERKIEDITYSSFKKLCATPEGLGFVSQLISKDIVSGDAIYYLVVSKWIALFSQGLIKEDHEVIIDLFTTVPNLKELLIHLQSSYLESAFDKVDDVELFTLFFNARTLIYLLSDKEQKEKVLGQLIFDDKRFDLIKNAHIKYLHQASSKVNYQTLVAPYLVFRNPNPEEYQRSLKCKKINLMALNGFSKYRFIFQSLPFHEALVPLRVYPESKDIFVHLQVILEKLRYNLEKNGVGDIDKSLLQEAFEEYSKGNNSQLEFFGWKLLTLFKGINPPRKWIKNLSILCDNLLLLPQKQAFYQRAILCMEPFLGPRIKEFHLLPKEMSLELISLRLQFLASCLSLEDTLPDFAKDTSESLNLFALFFKEFEDKLSVFELFKKAFPLLQNKKNSKVLTQLLADISKDFNLEDLQPHFNNYLSLLIDLKKVLSPQEAANFFVLFSKTHNFPLIIRLYHLLNPILDKEDLKKLALKTVSYGSLSIDPRDNKQASLIFFEALRQKLFVKDDFLDIDQLQLIPKTFAQISDVVQKRNFCRLVLDLLETNPSMNFKLKGLVEFLGVLDEDEIKNWSAYFRSSKQISVLNLVEESFTDCQLKAHKAIKVFNYLKDQMPLALSLQEELSKRKLLKKVTLSFFQASLQSHKVGQIGRIYASLIENQEAFADVISYLENQGLNHIESFVEGNSYLFLENFSLLLTLYKKSHRKNREFYLRHLTLVKKNEKLKEFRKDILDLFDIDIQLNPVIKHTLPVFDLQNAGAEVKQNNKEIIKIGSASFKAIATSVGIFCLVILFQKASGYYKANFRY
jgi:hypothetical protein